MPGHKSADTHMDSSTILGAGKDTRLVDKGQYQRLMGN